MKLGLLKKCGFEKVEDYKWYNEEAATWVIYFPGKKLYLTYFDETSPEDFDLKTEKELKDWLDWLMQMFKEE